MKKNNILIISILFIICLSYCINLITSIEQDFENLKIDLTKFKSYEKEISHIEGKKLSTILKHDLVKGGLSNKEFRVIIFVDTLKCMKCFNYHYSHLQRLSGRVKRIIMATHHIKMLKLKFPETNIYKINKNEKTINYNFFILFVDPKNNITYAELADRMNYFRSDLFYTRINNFINNNIIY